MAEKTRHPVWAWIMSNPCFYLFSALLLLLILLPLFQDSKEGKLWFTAMNLPVLVSSVGTLGRSRLFFWVAILLAGPAFGLLVATHFTGGSGYLTWSWRFSVGVFVVTLVHLVHYVLHPAGPEGMMIDRLYGGAAAYLLLGLLWCYFYAIREHFAPGSFAGLGPNQALHIADLVFFSFGRLTTAGGGNLVPQGRAAQMLVILEEVTGTLYMGGFVARLVAMYSSGRRRG
jgi:Ion channel